MKFREASQLNGMLLELGAPHIHTPRTGRADKKTRRHSGSTASTFVPVREPPVLQPQRLRGTSPQADQKAEGEQSQELRWEFMGSIALDKPGEGQVHRNTTRTVPLGEAKGKAVGVVGLTHPRTEPRRSPSFVNRSVCDEVSEPAQVPTKRPPEITLETRKHREKASKNTSKKVTQFPQADNGYDWTITNQKFVRRTKTEAMYAPPEAFSKYILPTMLELPNGYPQSKDLAGKEVWVQRDFLENGHPARCGVMPPEKVRGVE